MIQKMKKLTFLVTNKEYDKFISDIRELGIVHVDMLQQGATSDELTSALSLAERYKQAIKVLDFAKDSYTPINAYTAQPANADDALALLEEVERLAAEENNLKHQIDAVTKDHDLIDPWGEFSWDTIAQLEASGYAPYFYCIGNKQYKAEWVDKYFATPINELQKKIYFVAFSCEGEPDITAERIYLPKQSLSSLKAQLKELDSKLADVHEALLKINAESRASIEAGQIAADNDITLSKVHLSNESIAADQVKLMIGWSLEENAEQIVDYLEKSGVYYEIADPEFDDDVPIKIKNNKFATLFEPILRMYSLPNYHDIDPLPLFAPFFMLFFGLCMGDLGYGLIITAISVAIIFAKPDLKSYGQLGALLGGMTCICGFITGTFFGIDLAHVDWAFMKPIQP